MKGFFKTMFASALGFLMAVFLLFFIVFLAAVSSSREPEPYVRDNTVLEIKLSGGIPERTTPDPFQEIFDPRAGERISLQTLKQNLKKAAADDRIAGIKLNLEFVGTNWAILEDVRNELVRFREESGKFIYATTNDIGINEQAYYLATAADSIFAPPETIFLFDGFMFQGQFLGGTLEKLDIEPEIYNVGPHKSAADRFSRSDFSDADREQLGTIIETYSQTFAEAVAERNGLTVDEVHSLMNDQPTFRMQFGLDHGLVDELIFPNEFENRLRSRIGLDEDAAVRTISHGRYTSVSERSAGLDRPSTRDEIAVVYAEGPIMPTAPSSIFPGTEPVITYTHLAETLDDLKEDSNVKAIVLRINSPGGAATTSDMIWNKVREVSQSKPVIASMGGVAASGGYYIAMAADTIVAAPGTITGSIGVIAAKMATETFFEETLGITFDEVKSHEYAGWLANPGPSTSAERAAFAAFVDEVYDRFLDRAADSRPLSRDDIDAVGRGRVWTGYDALDNGLVDMLGGTDDAIAIAAEKAGLEEWTVQSYPRPKGFFEMFTGSLEAKIYQTFLPDFPVKQTLKQLNEALSHPRGQIWTIVPYELELK